jgi:hypothetical protein
MDILAEQMIPYAQYNALILEKSRLVRLYVSAIETQNNELAKLTADITAMNETLHAYRLENERLSILANDHAQKSFFSRACCPLRWWRSCFKRQPLLAGSEMAAQS